MFKEKKYWSEKLSGNLVKTYINYDKVNDLNDYDYEEQQFVIRGKLFDSIVKLSSGDAEKLHVLVTTFLVILLNKYTGNSDILIGTPMYKPENNRDYINTLLILRTVFEDDNTFKDLILKVRDNILEAVEHQNYPIKNIFNEIGLKNEYVNSLFDIAVMLDSIHDVNSLKNIGFNLIFSFIEQQDNLTCKVIYNKNSYEKSSIEMVIKNFNRLIECLFKSFEQQIREIDIIIEEDKQKYVRDFNSTSTEIPENKNIISLFEDKVFISPDKTAIVHKDNILTYSELSKHVAILSSYLESNIKDQNSIIAVLLDRSIEMIICFLAILKSGHCILPLDTEAPKKRINYILGDSNTVMLLSKVQFLNDINFNLTINIDDIDFMKQDDLIRDESGGKSDDYAYLIYTSGTTGNPKGVLINNKSILNYCLWAQNQYVNNTRGNMPLFSSPAFDLTLTSIFLPLISGNSIHIYSKLTEDSPLDKIMSNPFLDIIKLTPSHAGLLSSKKSVQTSISVFIFGGEQLMSNLAFQIIEKTSRKVVIYNEYGPTEATVGCMIYKFDIHNQNMDIVPIGKPINNCGIYVLDNNLNPTIPGAIGNIYISGIQLMKGYLNNPEITRACLVDSKLGNGVLYKTGDLAKWYDNEELFYMGRNDDQIKLNGIRIELREIESNLLSIKEIEKAIVLQNDMGQINAFVILKDGEELQSVRIEEQLKFSLPNYMVPSNYIQIQNIPLTINNKIDKNILYQYEKEMLISNTYVEPNSETEKIIISIWSKILNVQNIGIRHNFFQIGGDSILSITLLNDLNERFNVNLKLVDIYKNGTVEMLAKKIIELEGSLGIENDLKSEAMAKIEALRKKIIQN